MVVNLDMNTQRVTGIWMQHGNTYKVPLQNSNYHRQLINKQWRDPPMPLDVVQVRLSNPQPFHLNPSQTFRIIPELGPGLYCSAVHTHTFDQSLGDVEALFESDARV